MAYGQNLIQAAIESSKIETLIAIKIRRSLGPIMAAI
jgi:hypothetical protein